MVVCIWWYAYGGMHMAVCMWWYVYGGIRSNETSVVSVITMFLSQSVKAPWAKPCFSSNNKPILSHQII